MNWSIYTDLKLFFHLYIEFCGNYKFEIDIIYILYCYILILFNFYLNFLSYIYLTL